MIWFDSLGKEIHTFINRNCWYFFFYLSVLNFANMLDLSLINVWYGTIYGRAPSEIRLAIINFVKYICLTLVVHTVRVFVASLTSSDFSFDATCLARVRLLCSYSNMYEIYCCWNQGRRVTLPSPHLRLSAISLTLKSSILHHFLYFSLITQPLSAPLCDVWPRSGQHLHASYSREYLIWPL